MILALIQIIESNEERSAIDALFNAYFPKMQCLAYGILNNRQDAEDAAMETMRYICEHSEIFVDYKDPDTVSLVFMCVKSAAIDLYRKNRKRNELFICHDHFEENYQNIFEDDPSLSDMIVCEENNKILNSALDQLEDMYKIPILLKYKHFMRNKDIAELLKLDTNTVNGRMFRAKKLLKQKLQVLGYVK